MATASGIRAGRAYVELGADRSKLQSGLRKAEAACKAFASKARSSLEFGAAIAAPLALATKTFASFDDQMRLVQGVTGATGKQFEQLTETAKQLGATTSWTAAQVAEGMTSLGRAGFQSEEINKSIKGVMDLARATGTEIGPATDIASNALRSFGLQASEMNRVCDVLAATANGSAQTLEDLGEAFKYVAPLAASTGASIEDTAKIVGALANFGVKGSQAGTVFKNIQARMATDKKAQKKYMELGIDTRDAEGNLRKVNDVLIELGDKIKNMPSAEKLATIKTLFGQYGLTGVSLTTANFQALNDAIDQAGGTAAEVAEKMDAGIGGAIRVTKSAIEGLAISVGDALVPSLTELATKIQDAAGWLKDYNDAHPGVIANVAKFAGGLVAASAAVWATSKAVNAVVGGIKLLTGGYKLAVAAINVLTGATKAQRAAELAEQVVAAKTAALKQAEAVAIAAKTATAQAAANASRVVAAAELQEAQAAQVAARAKQASAAANAAALSSGLALGAAIAVVAALAYAYVKWQSAAHDAAKSALEALEAQERFSQEQAARRSDDRQLFEELQKLANQQSLTSDEFARAQYIVSELSARYGDLGIQCDETTKKILGMADAQGKFSAAEKEAKKRELQDEIAATQKALEANEKARKKTAADQKTGWMSRFVIVGGLAGMNAYGKLAGKIAYGKNYGMGNGGVQKKMDEYNKENKRLKEKLESLNRSLEYESQTEKTEEAFKESQQPTIPEIPTQAPAEPVVPAPETPSIPEKEPEPPKGFEPQKFDDFFGDVKEVAEKFSSGLNLDLSSATVEIPDLELPEIDPYNIQVAADSAVESARKTEAAGTFDAFEALDVASAWERDEMRRQTVAQQSLVDETRRTNKILQSRFAQDDSLFI